VGDAAERAACPIVGGNVTRASELSLTITVLGSVRAPLRRSGARVGDSVYVTGRLGGPGAALRALSSGRVADARHMARFTAPRPRIAESRWLADAGATSAIDISDGLAADAQHLARASGVMIELDATLIPRIDAVSVEEALVSGEEYELVVTFRGDSPPDSAAFETRFGTPLTRIGAVREPGSEPVRVTGARVDPARGHDHLS
jgi:thiamine-monophosphate kinase